jgi:uncharacterized NAD(P)/FAD-binding protein YdhS
MRERLAMRTIAILGAGFSGTMVAVHLLRAAGAGVRVLLAEKSGVFGPGLAYGTGPESLLLNVVAGRMSALPDEPEDFIRWARTEDPTARGEMFLPRRMYGRYLGALLGRAERESAGTLERVVGECVDVRPGPGGVEVELADGSVRRVDEVVLAPGNFAPGTPAWAGEAAGGVFIGDPWHGDPLAGVRTDDRVLILGTGLTMMDVTLSLAERGHRGEVTAISRRGLLSQAHRHGNPGLAQLPDPLFSQTFPSALSLLREVRRAAASAQERGGDWRDAVNALRSVTPKLWNALPEGERRRFMEHLAAFWNTHRHRAPQRVAEGIERLRASGRLRVLAGRVRAVSIGGGTASVDVCLRGESGGRTLGVERIVNCTGPTTDVARSGNPLLGALLRRGAVRPGPLGMGLDFDDEGRVVGGSGEPAERVWLVGPARIGRHWEATAVPELRVQARDVAMRLVERAGAALGAVRLSAARRGPVPR